MARYGSSAVVRGWVGAELLDPCPTTTALINELADRDTRVIHGGNLSLIIWEDELMQQTLNQIGLNA